MSTPTARLTDALRDRYVVRDVVGEGGMATVHRAFDLKHHRDVALKVLRPELSLAGDRFLREIRVTAGLQHPGIVPLYDSGEADGLLYYVMPLVEGESLRDRLDREGKLPLDEVLAIARAVAATLAYAHEKGVVHRDVKPENILFSGDQPLVADFGIARALSAAGGGRLTVTGHAVGSPAYMSPEQALGDDEIDGRTDVYSLGCVIFEMISGRPPFVAPTLQALIARRIAEPPPPLPGVPPEVARAVRRSLATQATDRFGTAAELARVLVELAARGTEPETPGGDASIVVLPLENLSPDPEHAFFSDGLTEEIIADLSHVRELRVISRTSAMRYKDTEKSLPDIAGELNVRYVLEGSVRRAGDAFRVTAQLIEAAADDHLWSGKFGGTLDDIFEVQESLSRQIVDALAEVLSTDAVEQLPERGREDPRALDVFMRVREAIWAFSPESMARAHAILDDAREVLDESALLLAARAQVLYQEVNLGLDVDTGQVKEAETLARRAIELDSECYPAYSALAWISSTHGDLAESVRLLAFSHRHDPSDSEAAAGLVFALALTGLEPAIMGKVAERLRTRDPFWPLAHITSFLEAFFQGDFREAASTGRHALKLGASAVYRFFLALALVEGGERDRALEVLEATRAREGTGDMWERMESAFLHALRGDVDATTALLDDEDLRAWAHPDPQYSWHLAQLHSLLGQTDSALEWLDRSVERGFSNHRFLREHERIFDPLRDDPLYAALVARAEARQDELRKAVGDLEV